MRHLLLLLPLLAASLIGASQQQNSTAFDQLERQAMTGNPEAMYRLSYLLETGRAGVTPDSTRADSLLRASAHAGYAPACNMLGYRYMNTAPDSVLFWIEKAALAPVPDPRAFNNLGYLLQTGQGGVRRDPAKALYWYERGAEAGVPTAMASLAEMLLDSPDAPRDTLRARELLTEAASLGFSPAGKRLYLLLEPQINSLSPDSALNLGLEYFNRGVIEVSVPLFMKASAADNPYALALLAQCYSQGWGVDYDYAHALHLFRHAALLGDPSAAFIVGETLQQFPDIFAGESTPDPKKRSGADWLQEAADAGIDDAHEAISRLSPGGAGKKGKVDSTHEQ